MPRQNRVAPSGDLIATPERGTAFGNRGVLHDDHGRIRRAWNGQRWLLCVLQFRGRRRPIMRPGHYTELFFLDEATGLAAGHRPCWECRRTRFRAFQAAWPSGARRAGEIDRVLHAERLNPDGSKRTYVAALDPLPDGVFVVWQGRPHLLWRNRLLAWSPGGYRDRLARPGAERATVLTPPSTVRVLAAGYAPDLHPSAEVE